MLLEFSVKNFRSFRSEARLSMVAYSPDRTLASVNLIPTGVKRTPEAVSVAAIYGANASGKSNLTRAMQLMRGLVAESNVLQPNQPLNLQPFMLDPETVGEPVSMEISFMMGGSRYQYGFSADPTHIVSEWLLVYRNGSGKPQTWFTREYDPNEDAYTYDFSSYLSGQVRLWEKSTKKNSLYLSTAAQLNSDMLTPVFSWITTRMLVFERGGVPIPNFTLNMIKEDKQCGVAEFMKRADTGISDVDVEEQAGFGFETRLDFATGNVDTVRREQMILQPKFTHQNKLTSATFGFEDESDGTQRLFSLFAPLKEVLRDGLVLVIDELDRSIHALLVREVVRMFQDPEINMNGAQLIFTTHDTTLMSADILRRDQIWFTEKDEFLASSLIPLSDFAVRKNEAVEKGYLSGRYGAIPILDNLKL